MEKTEKMEKTKKEPAEKPPFQEIYRTEGILNKDFVGQAAFTVCLQKTYRELDIEFSFDKQRYSKEDLTPSLKEEIRGICREKYNRVLSEEELERLLLEEMKTEIHTIAMLNDKFIGGIHRQLPVRHMYFTPEEAAEGCIPQAAVSGVLKVILVVFNVLMDNTRYQLTVRAR